MTFPNISFFFRVKDFYFDFRQSFLYNYYFKLHNILFTNLYIRIYRYKLIQLQKRNMYYNRKKRQQDRNLYLDKIKHRKQYAFKRSMKTNKTSVVETTQIRSFNLNFFLLFNKVESSNEWRSNKQRQKRKKGYVFINKFKDCGNQYDFDPFYPYMTYKLNDFDFYRVKKIKKQKISSEKKIFDLSIFDNRLKNINVKTFNNHTFNLLIEIYKKQKTNKTVFLHNLKNNLSFFYNFIFYFKKRIMTIKSLLFELKKKLKSYVYKLNFIFQILSQEKSRIDFLTYFKNKNVSFFSFYNKFVFIFLNIKKKYNVYFHLLITYKEYYITFFNALKKKYNILKQKKNEKQNMKSHFRNVLLYEKLHANVFAFAHKLSFFKMHNTYKWDKKNIINSFFITINKYITLYRSLFKYLFINKYTNNNAFIYIKATATNVFLYFIYNNKILYKKSCGELLDIKKKERRFWRNVYPLVESFLPFVMKAKNEYRFPFVSLYLNGSDSLCTPLLSSIRKHNKKFRRILYFLFNEYFFFNEKAFELKLKYQSKYILYPIYKLKYYSILDGFSRLSKIYFAINKIKDITSWPYNGCKQKKKKNVR